MDLQRRKKVKKQLFSPKNNTVILSFLKNSLVENIATHEHPETEVLLVLEGEATVCIENTQLVKIGEGDILFLDSMKKHRFMESDSVTEFSTVSLMFNTCFFINNEYMVFNKSTLDNFYLNTKNCVIKSNTRIAEKIKALFFDIEEEITEESNMSLEICKALVIAIYTYIISYFSENEKELSIDKVQHSAEIKETMLYIKENINENITLDELAKVANMSKTYYSTVFKKTTGMTVWEYILNTRIELATNYLTKDTDKYSITEILSMCGFNNATAFNKTFKKVTGKTPTQFKKSKDNLCF